MSDPVIYTAVLPVAEETVLFVSGLLDADEVLEVGGGRWAATGRQCWLPPGRMGPPGVTNS